MALSKPSFLNQLVRALNSLHHAPPQAYLLVRRFSFATPEEAAAERRKRKRRLRIEPPLSALRHQQQQQPPRPTTAPQNPNAPKLPEPASALSGTRLNLHNKILKLIRENDLEEAALFTRHSVYSNCRPTIHTCNAVMAAQLRQGQFAELLTFHRFITQAGIAANVVTYNILLTLYFDCRKLDLALEQYRQLINDAPFNPSPTSYRILIKGLVDNQQVEKAIEIKNEMQAKGFKPDPTIYSYLMAGQVKNSNADSVFELYEELKQKLGADEILDGVIYGNLMKGYFLKGMEAEAMEVYDKVLGEDSTVKMNAVSYNYVLEALSKNGKFDEALKLFERMRNEHDPPRKLSVNLGSYNVVADGYCAEKRFDEAVEVFNSMGEKRCNPDTLSCNVLIDQLCSNDKLAEAEELYQGMADKKVTPDEYTFGTLMDTCLKENRLGDAAHYFGTMVQLKLRPNLAVYNRLVEALVKAGEVDEAKFFFDLMVPKLRMNDDTYKFIMNALSGIGKHDEVVKIVDRMLREDPGDFTEELEEFVRELLRKEGMEDEVTNLKLQLEKEKSDAAAKAAEEAAKAKASTSIAMADLLSSKSFGKKPDVEELSAEGKEEDSVSTAPEVENIMRNAAAENENKLAEAEELYQGMADKNVNPDEYTFVTLIDTCLKENRLGDAAHYFGTMVQLKLRPNLAIYNRLVKALVKAGEVDEAKFFFDLMVPKLRMNDDTYKFIMNALSGIGKHDEVVKIVDRMLREDPGDFTEELEEFVRELLRKEGMEDEVTNLKLQLEKEKADTAAKAAEEAAKAKASTSIAMADLLSSKSFGKKPDVEELSAEGKEEDSISTAPEVEIIMRNDAAENEEELSAEGKEEDSVSTAPEVENIMRNDAAENEEELSAEGKEEDSVSAAPEVENVMRNDAVENEVIGEESAENEGSSVNEK